MEKDRNTEFDNLAIIQYTVFTYQEYRDDVGPSLRGVESGSTPLNPSLRARFTFLDSHPAQLFGPVNT